MVATKPNNIGLHTLQHHLFYMKEDPKNYLFIDVGTSIPIVTWKLTKNRSHIISDISIPGCPSHSGNNQRFKLDVESPSIPAII